MTAIGSCSRVSTPFSTVIGLRIAAILAVTQGLAHGGLFIAATPRHGPAEVALVAAMKANRFFAGGLGYWDFYFGYGLIAAGACVVEGLLLWQLGTFARAEPVRVRPMILVFLVANIGHAMLIARYFWFVVPAAFDLLIAVVLASSLLAAGRSMRA